MADCDLVFFASSRAFCLRVAIMERNGVIRVSILPGFSGASDDNELNDERDRVMLVELAVAGDG